MNTEKRIMVPGWLSKSLQEDFGVSAMAISRALRYISNTAQARAIRAAALERGGRVFDGSRAADAGDIIVLRQGQSHPNA